MISFDDCIREGISFPLNEIIKRYAEEQEISEQSAAEHALETKRYLILCALNPHKPYAMRGPIDEFWHTFVTFTPQYMTFCDKIAGRYIHHIPNTSPKVQSSYRLSLDAPEIPNAREKLSMRDNYAQMLADYEETFKEVPPVHLWPRPGSGDGIQPMRCGCACGVCGRECRCGA